MVLQSLNQGHVIIISNKIRKKNKLVKLTKTDEFSSVFSFRKRISAAHLAIHYQPNLKDSPRLGLVVSKKVAKLAVRRNYIRRVLREIFRKNTHLLPNFDLVVSVQSLFTQADFMQIEKEFNQLALKFQKMTATKDVMKVR